MINWLHLLWILPVTFFLGFLCAALLSAGKSADAWHWGYIAGSEDKEKWDKISAAIEDNDHD